VPALILLGFRLYVVDFADAGFDSFALSHTLAGAGTMCLQLAATMVKYVLCVRPYVSGFDSLVGFDSLGLSALILLLSFGQYVEDSCDITFDSFGLSALSSHDGFDSFGFKPYVCTVRPLRSAA
jgi:hypothetical protein